MKIVRERYLEKLVNLKDNGKVKIITGIRRSGKSYLLKELYKDYLIGQGIKENHIIYIALDDFTYRDLLNPLEFDKYVRNKIIDNEIYYLIFDEIQNIIEIKNPILTEGKIQKANKEDKDTINFVKVILGFLHISNVDIYITGSNSKFLSADIVTEFRDRGDEIYVLPLSFEEFIQEYQGDVEQAYEEYALHGGLPLIFSYQNSEDKKNYLTNLYNLTYFTDVMERNSFKKSDELNVLTRIMASSIGSLVNPNNISNTFNSVEKNVINKDTIYAYLLALENAFIIKKVGRIDVRGRKNIGATYKYYYTDLGIRNARLDFLHSDKGYVMENIVYNELIYRGYNVEVGSVDKYSKSKDNKTVRNVYEIDFVAYKDGKYKYIQCAYDINDEEKYIQETKSLSLIKDSFEKILITRNSQNIRYDDKGIKLIGIVDFLTNKY